MQDFSQTTPGEPVSGDFDGDGLADFVLFDNTTRSWHLKLSYLGSEETISDPFGLSTADLVTPMPADFDGDGKHDLAIYNFDNKNWYVRNSGTGSIEQSRLGAAGDLPQPGDYDGDGKVDLAVFRPSEQTWYFRYSSTGEYGEMLHTGATSADQILFGE